MMQAAFDNSESAVLNTRRVVIHVDLDAFYCQVEMIRLGIDPQRPMAVQQWANLIAVNYPARAAGIARGATAKDALKLCPELMLVHVETLDAMGNIVSSNHGSVSATAEAAGNQSSNKVTLRRYREASFGIFGVLTRMLGSDKVQKASIDEAFLDVTSHVDRFLQTGALPLPPASAAEATLTFSGSVRKEVPEGISSAAEPSPKRARLDASHVVLDNEADGTESDDRATQPEDSASSASAANADGAAHRSSSRHSPSAIIAQVREHSDWFVVNHQGKDVPCSHNEGEEASSSSGSGSGISSILDSTSVADVRIAAGAIIAGVVRDAIFSICKYTSSAGIAHNKMLAKLGSGRHKPRQQTLIPYAATAALMQTLRLRKIRFLGGKVGALLAGEIVAAGILKRDAQTKQWRRSYLPEADEAADTSMVGDDDEDEAPAADEDEDDSDEDEDEGNDNAGTGEDAHQQISLKKTSWKRYDISLQSKSSSASSAGTDVTDALEVVTAGDAQHLPLPALRKSFGDATGIWLYRIVRGVDDSAVLPFAKPKSLMAAKSFNLSACQTGLECCRWLRMLCAELAQRLAKDEEMFARQPKTLTLHYRRDGMKFEAHKSKSAPMPSKPRTPDTLLQAAAALLKRAIEDEGVASSSRMAGPIPAMESSSPATTASASSSSAASGASSAGGLATVVFPCSRFMLTASQFVDYGSAGGGGGATSAITTFFKPAPANANNEGGSGSASSSTAASASSSSSSSSHSSSARSGGGGIASMFQAQALKLPKQPSTALNASATAEVLDGDDDDDEVTIVGASAPASAHARNKEPPPMAKLFAKKSATTNTGTKTATCPICSKSVPLASVNAHVDACLSSRRR
jgi:nucleotidyltransferase/DNA polymerase involved in DNA repair